MPLQQSSHGAQRLRVSRFVAARLALMGLFLGATGVAPAQSKDDKVPEQVKSAAGLDAALKNLRATLHKTEPLSGAEALKRFELRPGFAVDFVAGEPEIRQPLNINFDERGRMWVTQYIQYPFPKNLKVVAYDQYIRAKFDKVPQPPPRHDRGDDVITILEDVDGDGSYKKIKTFVDGLSIATSALPGRGGVWVTNPPYLLFYPDRDNDDVPDGDPVVHLSGFGLEDTHAVASSLQWGPDGWIYGAHGSTCTAKIKVEVGANKSDQTTDFLGQAIWRYHPEKHIFEIFAEGGGNTFGVAFDDKGRVYSGTNWGGLRGVCFEQGAYYVKGWGKHGALTNPYAFGFFNHMPHSGNGDRLTHTFVIYGGGLLGAEWDGKIIGPNSLQSRIHVTRLEPIGSSYKTIEEPPLLSSGDGWFRPVDLKVGPDGALYVADMYEARINHVDPRDNWHRATGRLYRIRLDTFVPGFKPFNVSAMSNADLLALLSHRNRFFRETARRVLGDRKDRSVVPSLRGMLRDGTGQLALEALWGLHVVGGFDEASAAIALAHADPYVRMWAIRLLADEKAALPEPLYQRLCRIAEDESEPQVRSQLASSAKRLPGEQAVPIIARMIRRAADADDPHIPLLTWWALESKAVSHRDLVLEAFGSADVWRSPVARNTLMQRLARRYAAQPTAENQQSLLTLLEAAPGEAERKVLLAGVVEAFKGRPVQKLLPRLAGALFESGNLELALRGGDEKAHEEVLRLIEGTEPALEAQRLAYIEALGQVGRPSAAPVLLRLVAGSASIRIRSAALSALTRFEKAEIAEAIVSLYPRLTEPALRSAAISALLSRQSWTEMLLRRIQAGSISRKDLSTDQIDRIRLFEDKAVAALAEEVLGKPASPTSEEKQREIEALQTVLARPATAAPDLIAGKNIFARSCGTCHTLFKEGGSVGPDLTGYDRQNLEFWLLNTVDPNAAIREEFVTFRVKTTSKQSFVGLITDRTAGQITLVDSAQQKHIIAQNEIADQRALTISIMPEGLLTGMPEKDLRDLFAYLMKQ